MTAIASTAALRMEACRTLSIFRRHSGASTSMMSVRKITSKVATNVALAAPRIFVAIPDAQDPSSSTAAPFERIWAIRS